MVWTYIIIAVLLLAAELLYFKIADRCNIIDKLQGFSFFAAGKISTTIVDK